MDNPNNNLIADANQKNDHDAPQKTIADPAADLNSAQTSQDIPKKPENNILPDDKPSDDACENQAAVPENSQFNDNKPSDQSEPKEKEPIPRLQDKYKPKDISEAESDAELPHQPHDIRPDEIVEIEQEPPEVIITDDDVKKIEAARPAGPGLKAPKEEQLEAPPKQKQLEPLVPAKKENILPETLHSPEAVVYLKNLRSYLNELLDKANQVRITKSEKNLERIMEYAWETQKVTNDDVERITGVKHSQAATYLKKLVKAGKLERFGRYKYTFYKPIKK